MNKIENISILEDYKLKIIFEDNVNKIFNLEPYLNKGIFSELKDIEYLKQVKNNKTYISWPNEQDLSSDTLYYGGGKG